jgi:hypothetical protein
LGAALSQRRRISSSVQCRKSRANRFRLPVFYEGVNLAPEVDLHAATPLVMSAG